MTPELAVNIQDARKDRAEKLPDSHDFEQWVSLALTGSESLPELTIRIVDEQEIQQLNHDYRGKDKVTNVLSFSYDDYPEDYLGDIVICASVVLNEASERQVDAGHHWAHLVMHGILHLLGYDHENPGQAEEMESKEIELLAQLGIPNPYE